MFRLKAGLHNFQEGVFGSTSDLTCPTNVRKPDTLMIACSGQGTAPDNVSFGNPGRFSILQHFGASMPSKSECKEHEGLSCDGVKTLFDRHDFRHVIVCGHLGCAVIRYWLQPVIEQHVNILRQQFEKRARDLVDKNYVPHTDAERCALMVCKHVLCQIENLLTHPFVVERVLAEKTSFHGWVVDDETARVLGYSSEKSAFVPI